MQAQTGNDTNIEREFMNAAKATNLAVSENAQ